MGFLFVVLGDIDYLIYLPRSGRIFAKGSAMPNFVQMSVMPNLFEHYRVQPKFLKKTCLSIAEPGKNH